MEGKMVTENIVETEEEESKKKKGGMRSSSSSSGGRGPTTGNTAGCQAERCPVDLSDAKRYHRRHKVCELHSKASVVFVSGLRQRFCQQCSRFHELSEFDEAKRSCRRRLAGHNERRRKSVAEESSTPKEPIIITHLNNSTPTSTTQFKHYQIR